MTDPTREQRMAAIEPVVFEYTWLLSELTFLIHYRNLDDFLLGGGDSDGILAEHSMEPGRAREWTLPSRRGEWREAMRTRLLKGFGYQRLTEKPCTPHVAIAEAREAWRLFYGAVTDPECPKCEPGVRR